MNYFNTFVNFPQKSVLYQNHVHQLLNALTGEGVSYILDLFVVEDEETTYRIFCFLRTKKIMKNCGSPKRPLNGLTFPTKKLN